MRFVPIRSREQQAALSPHCVRCLLIKQCTQSVIMMRSMLANQAPPSRLLGQLSAEIHTRRIEGQNVIV
jgi:hypothetical protein